VKISAIIPVRNEAQKLQKCIASLKSSLAPVYQIIVIDDASEPRIEAGIFGKDISVIRLPKQRGPAYARNIGVKNADADIILFLDADVYVERDTIQKLEKIFKEQNEDAVVGVFDDFKKYRSFFSDYKNLWMRYTYERLAPRAALFYTSVAAIKKELFLTAGGFDEQYKRPSVEDTAFGNRLWKMGMRPLVSLDIKVFHDKEYSFFSILKTDLLRSADLVKMKFRKDLENIREGNRTSVPVTFMLSTATTIISLFLYAITGSIAVFTCFIFVSVILNFDYLQWLCGKRGPVFSLISALFILIDHLAVFCGIVYGFLSYFLFDIF